MSSSITLSGDWMHNIGDRRATFGTGNLGVYATGGVAISAAQVGLGRIDSMEIDPAGGYVFSYSPSTGLASAYVASGGTPTGTISQPTFTVKSGTIGTNMTLGLTADATTADVVGGAGITTNRTLSGTHSPVSTPTFTGTATSVSVAEVTSTTDITASVFTFRAYGV